MKNLLDKIMPNVVIGLLFGLGIVVGAFIAEIDEAGHLAATYIGIISGISINLTKGDD